MILPVSGYASNGDRLTAHGGVDFAIHKYFSTLYKPPSVVALSIVNDTTGGYCKHQKPAGKYYPAAEPALA